jgi:hypothetical protein
MARISIIVAFACKKLTAAGTMHQRNIGKSSLTSSVLLVGRGAIAAPSPEMAGVGSLTPVPKRIGLKSHIRLSGVRVKSAFDYVTRRFNASSAGLKNPWGCIFAETPLYAISRSNWSPESV